MYIELNNLFESNNDPKGRKEDFKLKLRRILGQNKYKYKYMFLRFTNNPERQTGINPNYSYDTPLGLYAYPFNETTIDEILEGGSDFEFASDMKSIIIFGWNNSNSKGDTIVVSNKWIIYNDGSYRQENQQITVEQYNTYYSKIKQYCLKNLKWFYETVIYQKHTRSGNYVYKNWKYFGMLDKDIYNKIANINNDEIVKLGIADLVNFQNTERQLEQVESYLSDMAREAKNQKYFTKIFNITRRLANENAKQWSRLMRTVCGISTIIDNGTSLIHGSEPFQAVFLEPHKTSLIAVLDNDIKEKQKTKDSQGAKTLKYLLEGMQARGYQNSGFIAKYEGHTGKYKLTKSQDDGIFNITIYINCETNYIGLSLDIDTKYSFFEYLIKSTMNKDSDSIAILVQSYKNSLKELIDDIEHLSSYDVIESKLDVCSLTLDFLSVLQRVERAELANITSIENNEIYFNKRKAVEAVNGTVTLLDNRIIKAMKSIFNFYINRTW